MSESETNLIDTFGTRRRPNVNISVDLTPPWEPDDEILEVFPFDDELTRKFRTDVEKCNYHMFSIFNGFVPYLCLPCSFHCITLNEADNAYCRWVAVSRENLYIIRKRRKQCWRFYCCDVGETRKVIPINNIQDVMVTEPAGTAVCCFVPNVLTSVELQTAAASSAMAMDKQQDASTGLLFGFENPKRFRQVVMNLKKGVYTRPDGTMDAAPPPAIMSRVNSLGEQTRVVEGSVAPRMGPSFAELTSFGGKEPSGRSVELLEEILETLKSIDKKTGEH